MRDPSAPRRATSTSTFGVSRRESHDASAFYERFTPPIVTADSEVAARREIDDIFCGDAARMDEVDDNSVALVVTSPPYFAGKEYETALGEGHVPATYAAYLAMLESVFAECVRTLEPGGRIAVNVANLGRKPYRSLSADIVWILQDRLRLLLRGEVIWVKARGATGSCAWGSFQRPSNPVLRDLTERIVIASKGRFNRAVPERERRERDLPWRASVTSDEFMEATTDVWEIAAESATRVGHPAPFPVELPERLIQLYTYRGDLVLDPFMGSGTTAVAAARADRHYVGYDTDLAYVERAKQRVDAERSGLHVQSPPDLPTARELTRKLLVQLGYTRIRADVTVAPGVDVTFTAVHPDGAHRHVELAGALTSVRPGLRRADVVWKVIAKAAVLQEAHPDVAFVVVTPAPAAPGPAASALEAVVGAGKPISEIIELPGITPA
ncbi:MAG TPA: site-specific DNA-methyltransferase [Acidimicrobiales bacterium]|nr:site-specific DNA-methyltransferase [Acidimicrobiales bacterium]